MKEVNPLVTINILSYNRKDELRNTFQKVYAQNYKNIEIIVVDNNSSDGSAEMVQLEFPDVRLIRLKKNIGIAGWNEGFKVAKGEYVLVLDDDSYPEENAIEEGIKCFRNNNKIGIVAFNVFNRRINKSETDGFKNPCLMFNGCGAIIKKEVINKIGYFNEKYFLYFHELDYSARCYDAGYAVYYLESAVVIHLQSLIGRKGADPFRSPKRFYFYFINYSIFLIQNFYWHYVFLYLTKWCLSRFIVCVKEGFYSNYFKALLKIFKNIKSIIRSRKVLKHETQKCYRFGNAAMIDREFFPDFKKPSFKFNKFFFQRAE